MHGSRARQYIRYRRNDGILVIGQYIRYRRNDGILVIGRYIRYRRNDGILVIGRLPCWSPPSSYGLWHMACGLLWPVAYYGLWPTSACGLLRPVAYYGLWPTTAYYGLWPTMACGRLWPVAYYGLGPMDLWTYGSMDLCTGPRPKVYGPRPMAYVRAYGPRLPCWFPSSSSGSRVHRCSSAYRSARARSRRGSTSRGSGHASPATACTTIPVYEGLQIKHDFKNKYAGNNGLVICG